MSKIVYVGLEPYQSRYTLQLSEWNFAEFRRLGVDFLNVPGNTIDNSGKINVGDVLDSYGRPYFALSQVMNILAMLREGRVTEDDVIFFEDMFHPGLEAIAYAFAGRQSLRPRIAVRCLAQTIDPDDFVHRTGISEWMRKFEEMTLDIVDLICFASEEFLGYFKASGMWDRYQGRVAVTGLPFGKQEVISRVRGITPFNARPENTVVFASRFDDEKQPHFFMDLIENMMIRSESVVKFAILSGTELKSNDHYALERARVLQLAGKLTIYENLSKNDYYEHLANARVLFNCSLQDWVSNTVSEADALGANLVFPAYRSFPEVFANDHTRLYIPWSLRDAGDKILKNLYEPSRQQGLISDYQDKTIERTVLTIDEIFGLNMSYEAREAFTEYTERYPNSYRSYLTNSKYVLR